MGALFFCDDHFVQRMNSTLRSLLPKAAVSKSLKLIRLSAKSMEVKGREPNSNVCEEPVLCAPGHVLIRQPEHLQSKYSISVTPVVQRRPRIRD